MKRIFAVALALAGCAQSAAAVDIPSDVSGVYVGSDRVCRVVLSRYQTLWVQLDLLCLGFSGTLSNSLTTLYAPGQCWNSGVATPFNGQTQAEFVAIRSYASSSAAIQIVRGPDQMQVANGIGIAETWNRVAPVQSPSPYACAGTAIEPQPYYPRLCRQYGLYCGG